MKNFISTFLACLVITILAALFLIGFSRNIWAIIFFIAFLLSVFITILSSVLREYEARIKELENKMEQILNKKPD